MTLTSVLRSLPGVEMVTLNFSSATGPELVHKTFDQYCQFKRTSKVGDNFSLILLSSSRGPFSKFLIFFFFCGISGFGFGANLDWKVVDLLL